jgi:pseudouridine-5'-phosphate glycosidase
MNRYLDITPEIKAALDANKPVVALESTILSHGMPYPENLTFAHEVEDIVRKNGAVPATIAILNGRLKVGLNEEELVMMCKDRNVAKVSRRDLPVVLSKGIAGATTVATTMIIADMAGIRVFATGGIGGVHRGAPKTFDISADLQELAHTSVAVVCAGCKSILDIGLTIEYLETMGVPVLGFGTKKFPAFYSRESGFETDVEIDTAAEVADILEKKWSLGLNGGVLVTNPVPEQYAQPFDRMEAVTKEAIAAADAAGIHGKEITPFLLAYIKDHTDGESLATNIQLAYHNAEVGAKIAVEYASLHK